MKNPVDRIRSYHAELKAIRHDIHAHPELAFVEQRTSALVVEYLKKWGIETHTGLARTGVVGVVQGKKKSSGRSVGLRADMECLPIHETNSFEHKSRHEGRMHACGHDGHTTMLLGAARYLAETREFDGTAYLIFQPAEEGGGGGQVMMKEGLFEKFPASEIYALHNWPIMPPGTIAAIRRPSTPSARRSSRRASASASSARATWSPTPSPPWAARTSPTCCRRGPAPTSGSARAAAPAAASCTTRASTSTTR